jgi:lipopolysaccharide transport system ATP-binding protein
MFRQNGEVSKGEGRTVLFVSHNMDAVNALCKSGIVLENGMVGFIGNAAASIDYYQSNAADIKNSWTRTDSPHFPHFNHISYEIVGQQPNLKLIVNYKTNAQAAFPSAFTVFGIKGSLGGTIMEAIPSINAYIPFQGSETINICEIELNGFIPGTYTLYAWLGASEAEGYDWLDDVLTFEITEAPTPERTFPYSPRTGFLVATSRLIK